MLGFGFVVCVFLWNLLIDCLRWPVSYCSFLYHPDTGIVIMGDVWGSGGYAATNE